MSDTFYPIIFAILGTAGGFLLGSVNQRDYYEDFCKGKHNIVQYQQQGKNEALQCKDGSYRIIVKEAQ